ncbi:heat-inducible transcriptional repressor HrcA, partial [candidate division KSB1 bacterium]
MAIKRKSKASEELSQRENLILRLVITNFISSGTPVGSRFLWKNYHLDMCPATIRNIMFDLEETGFVMQPHKSAGRVPTDKGIRAYIEDYIQFEELTETEKRAIEEDIESIRSNVDDLLKKTSLVLGNLSKQLGVVLTPNLFSGILKKIELVDVSDNKLLVVISLKTDLFKTIIIEIDSHIQKAELEETARVLTERLSGLTLGVIKDTIDKRLEDISTGNKGIMRYFIEYPENLFNIEWRGDVHVGGTEKIVEQPEFFSNENVKKVLHLLNDKKTIINIMEQRNNEEDITVTIGKENKDSKIELFSIITAGYTIGNMKGTLGIIGPRRMR